jgi:hypothetical protein
MSVERSGNVAVVIHIEMVCPSWLFIKLVQEYASELCDINGVFTPFPKVGRFPFATLALEYSTRKSFLRR